MFLLPIQLRKTNNSSFNLDQVKSSQFSFIQPRTTNLDNQYKTSNTIWFQTYNLYNEKCSKKRKVYWERKRRNLKKKQQKWDPSPGMDKCVIHVMSTKQISKKITVFTHFDDSMTSFSPCRPGKRTGQINTQKSSAAFTQRGETDKHTEGERDVKAWRLGRESCV